MRQPWVGSHSGAGCSSCVISSVRFSAIGCNVAPVFVATFLSVQTCGEISVAAIRNTYSSAAVGGDVKPAPRTGSGAVTPRTITSATVAASLKSTEPYTKRAGSSPRLRQTRPPGGRWLASRSPLVPGVQRRGVRLLASGPHPLPSLYPSWATSFSTASTASWS